MLLTMFRLARAVHPGGSPREWWRVVDLVLRQAAWRERLRNWYAGDYPALHEAVLRRPTTVSVLKRPYICLRWDAARRLAAMEDHYRQLAGRAGVLRVAARNPLRLAVIPAREAALEVVLDSPPWFIHEGEVSLNLFAGEERLYTLAFSLGVDDGERVAYIGALQGTGLGKPLETYRRLTRGLHGLRPRDLLLAAFRMLCAELGVTRILAVDDRHRVCESDYFTDPRKVVSSYDAVWSEHRGAGRPDGFFELPLVLERRLVESIASRKRAEYRRRYEMLDKLGDDIARGVHREVHS